MSFVGLVMHQQQPGVIHPESQKTKDSYRQALGLSEAHCIKTLGSAFHHIRHLYARPPVPTLEGYP